jgi:nitrogen fixation protein FixH
MNIIVTLPVGIMIIIFAFLSMRKLLSVSTIMAAGVLALIVIVALSLFAVVNWPGADVFAIHLALYLMTIYAMAIILKVRENNQAGQAARFHWAPAAIIGFFSIVIITNTFFILLAQSDGSVSWIKWFVPEPRSGGETRSVFPGTVSHDFREKENQFNEYQQQRAMQTSRGWRVKTGWQTKPLQVQPNQLLLQVNDAEGKPLNQATIAGKFLYSADFRHDRSFSMQYVGDGLYVADITLSQPGSWNLVVTIQKENELHELRARTTVH